MSLLRKRAVGGGAFNRSRGPEKPRRTHDVGQLRPFLHPLQRQEGESVTQRSGHVLGGASGKARVEPLPAGQQGESATVLDAIRE